MTEILAGQARLAQGDHRRASEKDHPLKEGITGLVMGIALVIEDLVDEALIPEGVEDGCFIDGGMHVAGVED